MDKQGNNQISWPTLLLIGIVIVAVVMGARTLNGDVALNADTVTLAELVTLINEGKVTEMSVRGDDITITLRDETTLSSRKESGISLTETLSLMGVSEQTLRQAPIQVNGPAASTTAFQMMFTIVPLVIIGWFALRLVRSMRSGQDQAMSFGRSTARVTAVDNPLVTFEDVAGAEEAKHELEEVVGFLKNPDKFLQMGARVPRGVLMIGPPGTGKTLLARAVAGEAGVPFLNISGSEFVEMFVGVGASRVRDLFKKAREIAPAIVFVDEIDAVGRRRGAGLGGGHDEREQTLNQILVEMDGFDNETNIILIAATNRADVLDPALLRPGRFDRKVHVDRPDVKGREQILEVHSRGKPLHNEVNLATIASLTPGFSGADIANLVNEAAILAAQRDMRFIGMKEMEDALEKVIAGPERRSKVVSPEEREVVAFHEAGHAVVMHHLEFSDPVHKITIIPRGAAGGYTMSLPESMDSGLISREQLEDMITGLLGGRAAEELTFQRITTGASNDLERATGIARAMVTRYGMSDRLGLRVYGEEGGEVFMGMGRPFGEARNYSEEAARAIDEEVNGILSQAYNRAVEILNVHRDKLLALADALLEIETVDRTQFEAMMMA